MGQMTSPSLPRLTMTATAGLLWRLVARCEGVNCPIISSLPGAQSTGFRRWDIFNSRTAMTSPISLGDLDIGQIDYDGNGEVITHYDYNLNRGSRGRLYDIVCGPPQGSALVGSDPLGGAPAPLQDHPFQEKALPSLENLLPKGQTILLTQNQTLQ